MKKYLLLFALASGLAVTSTSEVQGQAELLPLFIYSSLVAGATWPISAVLFGSQAALRDKKEMATNDKIMVGAGLLILPINIISFICILIDGTVFFSELACSFYAFVFGVSLIALIGLTVGNIIFNIGKQIFKLFTGEHKLSLRKQRKRARHKKRKQKLVIAATV